MDGSTQKRSYKRSRCGSNKNQGLRMVTAAWRGAASPRRKPGMKTRSASSWVGVPQGAGEKGMKVVSRWTKGVHHRDLFHGRRYIHTPTVRIS